MFWSPLQKGDLIDVVVPAWPSSPSHLKQGVAFLKSHGFAVRLQKNIFQKTLSKSSHWPGDLASRLQGLQTAFFSKDSQAILCLRGGSGSLHLLPTLLKWKKPKKCKPFIGLSDISLLHYFINIQWNWPSLHGTMLSHLGDPDCVSKVKKDFLKVLQGQITTLHYKNLKPLNKKAQTTKKVQGQVIGGNLTTLQSLIGTPLTLKTKGKILFLEEVNERGYRIDRMLHHLKWAGCFKGVKAIVLGRFLGGKEPSGPCLTPYVLTDFFASFQVPVWKGLPCGHGKKQNILPFNTYCVVQAALEGWDMLCQTGVQKT